MQHQDRLETAGLSVFDPPADEMRLRRWRRLSSCCRPHFFPDRSRCRPAHACVRHGIKCIIVAHRATFMAGVALPEGIAERNQLVPCNAWNSRSTRAGGGRRLVRANVTWSENYEIGMFDVLLRLVSTAKAWVIRLCPSTGTSRRRSGGRPAGCSTAAERTARTPH